MMKTSTTTTNNIWDKVASEYEEYSYEEKSNNYPANKYRAKILLDFFKKHPKGRILDAGCGTGFMTREMLKRGYEVVSVDSSKEMLSVAEKKTKEQKLKGQFIHSTVNDLSIFDDNTFDFVMLNGVLPYIPCEEEGEVFAEVRRVLKPGGYLLSSHYNLFFDFFRFDRYSVSSMVDGLFGEVELNGRKQEMFGKLASMLADPDFPAGDARTMKNENPITYKEKLSGVGFDEVCQGFYNFYCLPPRVKTGKDVPTRKQLEEKFHNSWQGLFLAKTFVSIAQKPITA